MRKREYRVQVRLNEAEYVHYINQVSICGLTQEVYLRKLIMGKKIKPRAPQEYHDLLREVRAIGNNINQIARVANTDRSIIESAILEIIQLQRRLLSSIKGLI